MKKLGILIDSAGHTQKYYTICTQLNKLKEEHPDVDVTVFYYDYDIIPIATKFSMMEMAYAFNHDGILIATSAFTAPVLPICLRPKKRYFYVWDIDWNKQSTFNHNTKEYLNPGVDLIAKSSSHYNLISKI